MMTNEGKQFEERQLRSLLDSLRGGVDALRTTLVTTFSIENLLKALKVAADAKNDGAKMIAKTLLEKDYQEVFKVTTETGRKSLFMWAIVHDNMDFVQGWLELGFDINSTINGNTGLHVAARVDNLKMVQFLLSNEANYTMKNQHDRTPEQIAERKNAVEIITLLQSLKDVKGAIATAAAADESSALGTPAAASVEASASAAAADRNQFEGDANGERLNMRMRNKGMSIMAICVLLAILLKSAFPLLLLLPLVGCMQKSKRSSGLSVHAGADKMEDTSLEMKSESAATVGNDSLQVPAALL
jgi:hypothetical protein